jgi:hypothetical protein
MNVFIRMQAAALAVKMELENRQMFTCNIAFYFWNFFRKEVSSAE